MSSKNPRVDPPLFKYRPAGGWGPRVDGSTRGPQSRISALKQRQETTRGSTRNFAFLHTKNCKYAIKSSKPTKTRIDPRVVGEHSMFLVIVADGFIQNPN